MVVIFFSSLNVENHHQSHHHHRSNQAYSEMAKQRRKEMPDKRSPEWLMNNSLDRIKKKRRRQDLPPYGNNFYSTPQENRRRPYKSGYGRDQSGSGSENHTSRARRPLPSQRDYFDHQRNRDLVRKIPKVMGQSGVRGNKEIED